MRLKISFSSEDELFLNTDYHLTSRFLTAMQCFTLWIQVLGFLRPPFLDKHSATFGQSMEFIGLAVVMTWSLVSFG